MDEEWRPISGADGYDVSDLGRVRSWWLPRTKVGTRMAEPHVLKPSRISRGGHLYLNLRRAGWGSTVHRLVLEAFVGPCPPGMEARHFPDRDPANNSLGNLSWATPKENCADREAHGTYKNGMTGRNHSAETRAKISKGLRAHWNPPERK